MIARLCYLKMSEMAAEEEKHGQYVYIAKLLKTFPHM
jgi:hypothetical protein